MKCFLRSIIPRPPPLHLFTKGSCQFLAKESTQVPVNQLEDVVCPRYVSVVNLNDDRVTIFRDNSSLGNTGPAVGWLGVAKVSCVLRH